MGFKELLQRAVSHHGNGHLEQACQLYQEVLAEDSHNFDATHLYACVLSQQKKFEESILLFERAIRIKPQNSTVW